MKFSFLICCVTESKLDSSSPDSFISVPGYRTFRSDRTTRGGGGSVIFLCENLSFLQIFYEVDFPLDVEVNCFQVLPPFKKPFVLVLIYRPPVEALKSQFIRSLESLLFHIEQEKINYVIQGDLNFDFLQPDNLTRSLISVTTSYSLQQLIKVPTRVTPTCQTLLDPIFVNFPQNIKESGVFSLTTSDHRFTYCVVATKKCKSPPVIIKYRSTKNVDWSKVAEDINKLDWNPLQSIESCNDKLDYFQNNILNVLNVVCPLRKKRIKCNSINWMNDFVLNLIDKRNAMKQDCDVYPSVEKMQEYRKFKNYVKNQIFKAKRLYFKSNFENYADSKNISRTYDELTGKNITNLQCSSA
jgi:hypothetical protein